jgi:hypothetical protein
MNDTVNHDKKNVNTSSNNLHNGENEEASVKVFKPSDTVAMVVEEICARQCIKQYIRLLQ